MGCLMKPIGLNAADIRRLEMVGDTTDSPGIKQFKWPGMKLEPMSSGAVLLVYGAEPWALRELWEKSELWPTGPNHDLFLGASRPEILVHIFKVGGFFKSAYGANVQFAEAGRHLYVGSVANRSLEELLISIREYLNLRRRLLPSTEEAIQSV